MPTFRELAALLRDLREAGWRRTIEWEASPRDQDGAPWTDNTAIHQWVRGTATITLPTADNHVWAARFISYDLGEGDDFTDIGVGAEWVEARGIRALRRLAEAAGVLGDDLYPPRCARCNGGGMTGSVLGAEECGECGGLGVLMPARWSSPMGEAVPA